MMNNPNMNGAPAPNPAFIPQVPLELPHYGCSFTESIKRFFLKYATFKGRASRSEFWYARLLFVIVALAFDIAEGLLGGGLRPVFRMLEGVWDLVILVPDIAVTVRRLHDSGKSGYWWFAAYGPMIGGLLFIIAGAGTAIVNAILSRGESMGASGTSGVGLVLVGALACLAGFIIFIVLMVAREKPEGMRFDGPVTPMPGAPYGYPAGMANQPNYGPAQPMPQQQYYAGDAQQPSQPQQAYQAQQSGQPNYAQQTASQPQQPFGQPQQPTPWPDQQQPSVPLPNRPVEQQQGAAYATPTAQPQANGFNGGPFNVAEQPVPANQTDQYPPQPFQAVPQSQPQPPQPEVQPYATQVEGTQTEGTPSQESSPYEPIQTEPQQAAEGLSNGRLTSSDAGPEANNTNEQDGNSPTADETK